MDDLRAQDKEIDQSRTKFKDQIQKIEKKLEKLNRDSDKNTKEAEQQMREVVDL